MLTVMCDISILAVASLQTVLSKGRKKYLHDLLLFPLRKVVVGNLISFRKCHLTFSKYIHFVLTLEATRCTQLRLGVQNLASSGAGMVASRNGLTRHVIP
jgi:hypothetical protein